MSRRTLGAYAGVLVAVGTCTLPFRDDRGADPGASSPPAAGRARLRDEALRDARTRLTNPDRGALTTAPPDPTGTLLRESVDCQFVPHVPDGTTFKFDCTLASGETAATQLLAWLGYAADHVYVVVEFEWAGARISTPGFTRNR